MVIVVGRELLNCMEKLRFFQQNCISRHLISLLEQKYGFSGILIWSGPKKK